MAQDVQAYEKMGKHLMLTFKSHKFEVKSKNMTLDRYVENEEDIYRYSLKILAEAMPLDPLRLIGIKIGNLIDKEEFKRNSLEKYFVQRNTEAVSEPQA